VNLVALHANVLNVRVKETRSRVGFSWCVANTLRASVVRAGACARVCVLRRKYLVKNAQSLASCSSPLSEQRLEPRAQPVVGVCDGKQHVGLHTLALTPRSRPVPNG
jgi:hypothetical protein